MAVPVPAKQTFNGSCHCGFIQYTAALPITDTPVASRCNCTICLKIGYTSIRISPEDFKLIAPSSESEVKNYQMRSKDINKYFCANCGIHCWSNGKYEFQGVVHHFFTINILTLDQPQEGLDLSKFKIRYSEGRSGNWTLEQRDQPYPGGAI
jgi:hypothetical protein